MTAILPYIIFLNNTNGISWTWYEGHYENMRKLRDIEARIVQRMFWTGDTPHYDIHIFNATGFALDAYMNEPNEAKREQIFWNMPERFKVAVIKPKEIVDCINKYDELEPQHGCGHAFAILQVVEDKIKAYESGAKA